MQLTENYKIVEAKEVAKLVRKALKDNFPGIKFSVRTDKASYSHALNISWTDGPTSKAVENVVEEYKGGDFNGMEDIYEPERHLLSNPDGSVELVRYGADYIFCRRDLTEEFKLSLLPELEEAIGEAVNMDKEYFYDMNRYGDIVPSQYKEFPSSLLYRLAHYREA